MVIFSIKLTVARRHQNVLKMAVNVGTKGRFTMLRWLNLVILAAFLICTGGALASADEPTVQSLLDQVGIKPQGDQRGQTDTVGFASTAQQMDQVLLQCGQLATGREKELEEQYGWDEETAFVAAVCPHDDYYYAGGLYKLLLPHIRAKRVILFGVFHKARLFNCQDRLVFDNYKAWHGPYGPVAVSTLREDVLKRLPPEDYVVDNDMQMVEHSVEAIVPFLQAYNREVEIVSILVPYMDWNVMDKLAADLSFALIEIFRQEGWKLGEDIALICSADAVHYGDSGWGGSNFAPFGADIRGYRQAVKRDTDLAENYLCGILQREKLMGFLNECVDPSDVRQYLITWCGRFSIPFGLNVASRLVAGLESRTLHGTLLDYGTSISEASLDIGSLEGMGPTAPNNLHHWVGYAAIGYK